MSRPFPLLNIRHEFKVQDDQHRGGFDVLRNFSVLGEEAGCESPQNTPAYIDNLCRLGLAEVPSMFQYTVPGVYDNLENHPTVLSHKQQLENHPTFVLRIERRGLKITDLGRQFCHICVVPHEQKTKGAI